ncbi:hypothetical protein RJT34_02726 [Clitoria ternatea]|uniref:Uncharacterized protein n=1 Tax=Clitoria ternatea TaxID=43366 RepID=A0AAN9KIX5_CLITE
MSHFPIVSCYIKGRFFIARNCYMFGQDSHLLQSSTSIRFLVKLLRMRQTVSVVNEEKEPTFGSRLVALQKKAGTFKRTKEKLDSSSVAILSRVEEILACFSAISLDDPTLGYLTWKDTVVKNKTPALIQITTEQILREAREYQEAEIRPPKQKITDPTELGEYHLRKPKEFEDLIRRVDGTSAFGSSTKRTRNERHGRIDM